MLDAADLPDDIVALKAMLIAAQAREVRKDERIERLEKLVAAFKQAAFGRKSEKADPEQFDLALEDPDRVGPDIRLAYCWAHARRKLVDITRTGTAPIAEDGVKRIGELYRIEAELRGLSAEARFAGRQERSAPLIADMRTWLTQHRARVAGKSPLGEALAYIAKHWDGLCVFLTDGRIEIDNNSVERTIRPIALNRKNALFAGHDAGAENWATIASLIETCKLNGADPFKYLSATLTALINGHKQGQIAELLPWNFLAVEHGRQGAVGPEAFKFSGWQASARSDP